LHQAFCQLAGHATEPTIDAPTEVLAGKDTDVKGGLHRILCLLNFTDEPA
jgi:hypothetical protein